MLGPPLPKALAALQCHTLTSGEATQALFAQLGGAST